MSEALREQGNALFQQQDYASALEKYTEAISVDPENAVLYGNRSAALMALLRYEAALADATKAVELDSANQKHLARLARVRGLLGDVDQALALFERISPAPATSQVLPFLEMQRNLKQARTMSGKSALYALDAAQRGLGKGVTPPYAWRVLRAQQLAADGRSAEAESEAITLLREKQTPEVLVLRAQMVLKNSGDVETAVAHFRQALQLDPDNAEARVLFKSVKVVEAEKQAGNDAFKARDYQSALGRYSAAIDACGSVLTGGSTLTKLYSNRASTNTLLGNYADAVSDADAALELDENFVKALRLKARALGQLDRWEESAQTFRKVVELDPSDTKVRRELQEAELELKKSKRKDYYKILGVEKTATIYEIKKGYRRQALVHHPDKNPGDEAAAEKFKECTEAYETLSDEQKRARYDSGVDLQDDPYGGFGGGGFGGMDAQTMFDMFGGGRGGASFGGASFGGSPFGGASFGGSQFGGSQFGGSQYGGSPFGGF